MPQLALLLRLFDCQDPDDRSNQFNMIVCNDAS